MSRNAASAEDGNFRIEVTDFGPIAHADVDLRPLTVFAGPSNTGKSYLAMLVYALYKCFGGFGRSRFRISRHPLSLASSMVRSLPDREALATRIAEWSSTATDGMLASLPEDLETALRPALEQIGGADRHLAQEVSRCFGVYALDDLVRRGSVGHTTTVTLSIPWAGGDEQARYRLEFGRTHTPFFGQLPAAPLFAGEIYGSDADLEDGHYLLREVLDAMLRSLIRPLTRTAYYLPAGRTGMMHSHQVVVSTLIQNATTAGLRPSTNVPLLSGVLADFLDDLIGMSQSRRRPFEMLARALEKNLVAGAVRLQRSETGYPSFAYRPAGWDTDLPFMLTSSMVSEIAPVVLYLRHLVHPQDVLIIEEPESHLHPAMQAVFARDLARLVRSGVRVMLTTHSEWILEALANLVRLAELPESRRKGITGADVALSSDEVGAWMFTPNAADDPGPRSKRSLSIRRRATSRLAMGTSPSRCTTTGQESPTGSKRSRQATGDLGARADPRPRRSMLPRGINAQG